MLNQINKTLVVFLIGVISLTITPAFAVLSCSVTTVAGCSDTVVLRMSSDTNAHSEVATGTTPGYANNAICCNNLSGILCAGKYASVLKLSSTTNAHVEVATNNNYINTACIASNQGEPVIAYQDNNCTGYDTTLASISSTTNATIGTSTVYTKKVCGSLLPFSLTFNISTTTAYFGTLSSVAIVYASSTNVDGSSVEVEAHYFDVKTNTIYGYTVNVQGQTLTSGANTITAIGNTNTAPSIGTEQFGIRIIASGGSGVVSIPYTGSGFAYNSTATTSSQVASAITGDSATTTYSVRYVGNLAGTSKSGLYFANIVYVATANF